MQAPSTHISLDFCISASSETATNNRAATLRKIRTKVLTSEQRRSLRRRSQHLAAVNLGLACLRATSCALVRPANEKSEFRALGGGRGAHVSSSGWTARDGSMSRSATQRDPEAYMPRRRLCAIEKDGSLACELQRTRRRTLRTRRNASRTRATGARTG